MLATISRVRCGCLILYWPQLYLDISINFWIKFAESKDYEFAKSDAIKCIIKAFKENNIKIPYPTRLNINES